MKGTGMQVKQSARLTELETALNGLPLKSTAAALDISRLTAEQVETAKRLMQAALDDNGKIALPQLSDSELAELIALSNTLRGVDTPKAKLTTDFNKLNRKGKTKMREIDELFSECLVASNYRIFLRGGGKFITDGLRLFAKRTAGAALGAGNLTALIAVPEITYNPTEKTALVFIASPDGTAIKNLAFEIYKYYRWDGHKNSYNGEIAEVFFTASIILAENISELYSNYFLKRNVVNEFSLFNEYKLSEKELNQ